MRFTLSFHQPANPEGLDRRVEVEAADEGAAYDLAMAMMQPAEALVGVTPGSAAERPSR